MAKMLHIVLLQFKPGREGQFDRLCAALDELRGKLPGGFHFTWGPYSSPEGANRDFTHAFVMTFPDAAARDYYLFHPEHEKIKETFLPDVENVIAFDFADR